MESDTARQARWYETLPENNSGWHVSLKDGSAFSRMASIRANIRYPQKCRLGHGESRLQTDPMPRARPAAPGYPLTHSPTHPAPSTPIPPPHPRESARSRMPFSLPAPPPPLFPRPKRASTHLRTLDREDAGSKRLGTDSGPSPQPTPHVGCARSPKPAINTDVRATFPSALPRPLHTNLCTSSSLQIPEEPLA